MKRRPAIRVTLQGRQRQPQYGRGREISLWPCKNSLRSIVEHYTGVYG